LNIGIDITVLNINQAGSASYTRNLIHELKEIIPKDELSIFTVKHRRDMSQPKSFLSRINTIYRDLIWTHFVLPQKALRAKVDVLHVPANVIPLFSKCPTVLTILDTTILQTPKYFTFWHKNYSRVCLPLSAKKATVILTISENSKRDIIKQFNIAPEKIIVTYLAASKDFKTVSIQEIDRVKKYYNLNSFILNVASLEPRKNIPRLLQAYASLIKRGFKPTLVHVGPQGWLFDEIFSEVRRLGLSEKVRFLGYIPAPDLVALYNAASLFVYPSLYEGFGLPVLEAMACGCPVVTSNTSSLPEVVGNAGIMVDPYDVLQIAATIENLCQDQQKLTHLRNEGLKRTKLFSWQRCAKETLDAYHLAMEKK
jgi:glycosyltransferase involved in cell wall biosynthesis